MLVSVTFSADFLTFKFKYLSCPWGFWHHVILEAEFLAYFCHLSVNEMLSFDACSLPYCTLAWGKRSPACPCSDPWWPWHQAKDSSLIASFTADYLTRQSNTGLNKLPSSVLTEWIVMTITFYACTVSFIQYHDNASKGGGEIYFSLFLWRQVWKIWAIAKWNISAEDTGGENRAKPSKNAASL